MAFTSAKMGLRIWNLLTDLYDHNQLADNWAKVDYHDHSPGKGVQIPTEGLADGAVTGPKLAAALDPSGAYTFYRDILVTGGVIAPAMTTATPATFEMDGAVFPVSQLMGQAQVHIDPADYAVSGRTPMLRLKFHALTNSTNPNATMTAGLYQIAGVEGGTGTVDATGTLGSPITNSTVVIAATSANLMAVATSVDFAVPTVGWYTPAFLLSGATAANSRISGKFNLQIHWV